MAATPRPSAAQANAFLDTARFVWHQRFELANGVYTPGEHDIDWLLDAAGIPEDLEGLSVLDIGTSNGGAAFIAERRNARRVVAMDIYPVEWFGFGALRAFLGSSVEYLQASVYELPQVLDESFDVVLFLGVLYHLRHPLLALDAVRTATAGDAYIETAVADQELPDRRSSSLVRFYRGADLGGDPSNWFAPTVKALVEWCDSSGLSTEVLGAWPADLPARCLVKAARLEGPPEFETISYERQLSVGPVPGPSVD